jgi:hypothetical protein
VPNSGRARFTRATRCLEFVIPSGLLAGEESALRIRSAACKAMLRSSTRIPHEGKNDPSSLNWLGCPFGH